MIGKRLIAKKGDDYVPKTVEGLYNVDRCKEMILSKDVILMRCRLKTDHTFYHSWPWRSEGKKQAR